MRQLESPVNGETSSAGDMQMKRGNIKRKRHDSNHCHQCHESDKETVLRCTKCKRKKYCIPCISKCKSMLLPKCKRKKYCIPCITKCKSMLLPKCKRKKYCIPCITKCKSMLLPKCKRKKYCIPCITKCKSMLLPKCKRKKYCIPCITKCKSMLLPKCKRKKYCIPCITKCKSMLLPKCKRKKYCIPCITKCKSMLLPKCKRKKYCIPCITKWYTKLGETDFAEACPVCRNICNCEACLKSDVATKDLMIPDLKLSMTEKIQHLKDIVRALLPFLKQFIVEEDMEREEEARIQGLPITRLQLLKSNLNHNDQVHCNNCKTSIFNIHRSCMNCSYKLCVTCCREIRDSILRANHQYLMHNQGCSFTSRDGNYGAASFHMDDSTAISKWILTNKGAVACPPASIGGCGCRILELKSTYPDTWMLELLWKAEKVAEAEKASALEASEGACSCSVSHQGSELESATLKIDKNDPEHFRWHLCKGDPAVVPNVLSDSTGLSWEPLVLWRACRNSRKTDHFHFQDFRVLNSSNWCEETMNMLQFFKGYAEGLFDSESQLKILKLEDWPPAESFQERLPRHFWEFVRCLPFKHYTHPHARYLNLLAKLPNISLKADLGPKMCICYGVGQELGFGSITKIHYAASDRVNILMHAAAICLGPKSLSMLDKLKKTHVTQDPVLFSVSNEKANKDVMKYQQCQMKNENKGQKIFNLSISRSRIEEPDDPEAGAIWDVFRRQDVTKLEEYLRKHAEELTDISFLQQLVHAVHEKAFYLTEEHIRKLKEEYGIEPWTFVQRPGDAVFIPVGCPHQIRNLKSCTSVVVNFVSPESVGECIRLSTEYRSLPDNHICKEDKLQVKKMTLHAICNAVEYLDMITLIPLRSPVTPPLVSTDAYQNPVKPGGTLDLVLLKQRVEAMKLFVLKKGHLLQPDEKAYLLREFQNYLNKISRS